MFFSRFAAAGLLCASTFAVAIEAGQAAPAVAGKRLDQPGASVASDATRGQVVYVDFWASWCVPCRQSMPALDALHRKHGPAGFTVVGVNKDVNEADAKRFMGRFPVGFPLVADEGDSLARAFGVKAMPSGYLIDRKGVVRHVHRGFTAETAAALETEIQSLLGESR
jgi:thiol-disulfide isomerase/thioredoxin